MAFPPVLGADHERLSWSAVGLEAVGVAGAAGTVVMVTAEDAVDSAEFPEALDATTLKV
jgi:hypothetical protein